MVQEKSKKLEEVQISQKELIKSYIRLHKLLSSRVKNLKKESSKLKNKDKKKFKEYSNSAVDLYAFTRLMELCQNLTKDVKELEDIIAILGKVSSGKEKNNLN